MDYFIYEIANHQISCHIPNIYSALLHHRSNLLLRTANLLQGMISRLTQFHNEMIFLRTQCYSIEREDVTIFPNWTIIPNLTITTFWLYNAPDTWLSLCTRTMRKCVWLLEKKIFRASVIENYWHKIIEFIWNIKIMWQ